VILPLSASTDSFLFLRSFRPRLAITTSAAFGAFKVFYAAAGNCLLGSAFSWTLHSPPVPLDLSPVRPFFLEPSGGRCSVFPSPAPAIFSVASFSCVPLPADPYLLFSLCQPPAAALPAEAWYGATISLFLSGDSVHGEWRPVHAFFCLTTPFFLPHFRCIFLYKPLRVLLAHHLVSLPRFSLVFFFPLFWLCFKFRVSGFLSSKQFVWELCCCYFSLIRFLGFLSGLPRDCTWGSALFSLSDYLFAPYDDCVLCRPPPLLELQGFAFLRGPRALPWPTV